MSAAAITMLVLIAISGGITLALNGQPKTGNHNFFIWAISAAINIAILNWGGFFN